MVASEKASVHSITVHCTESVFNPPTIWPTLSPSPPLNMEQFPYQWCNMCVQFGLAEIYVEQFPYQRCKTCVEFSLTEIYMEQFP